MLKIAHRGNHHQFPENSISAFETAFKQGADAVECDVSISEDGHVYVCHDLNLKRLFNLNQRLSKMKSKEIDLLSFPDFPNEKMPRLEYLCEHLSKKGLINIEIKHTNGRNKELSEAVLRIIERQNCSNRVWISSFNPYILSVINSGKPKVKTALLFDKMKYFPIIFADLIQCDAWHPNYKMIDSAFMKQADKRRKEVYVWTVNQLSDIQRMKDFQVSGIISDDPHLI